METVPWEKDAAYHSWLLRCFVIDQHEHKERRDIVSLVGIGATSGMHLTRKFETLRVKFTPSLDK